MKSSIRLAALALFLAAGTAAAATHYHVSKVRTYHYHAPKLYAPKTYPAHTVPVRGYFKSMMPSHRTSPNSTQLDNWTS